MPEALIRIRSPYKFLEESLYTLYIALRILTFVNLVTFYILGRHEGKKSRY